METISPDELCQEARRHVPGWQAAAAVAEEIAKGGSDRRYWRLTCGNGSTPASVILMVYTTRRPDNRCFFPATEVLRATGARTLEVYHHDAARKIAWLEDLGLQDLWERRQEEDAMDLYRDTLREVARLHRTSLADVPDDWRGQLMSGFDAALYQWEQDYFFDEFARRFSGLSEAELTRVRTSAPLARMRDTLAALPRTLVHRDFQSQNVIVRGTEAWMIDYQGLREGRPEYDLASLVYDPYVTLTADERADLIQYYQDHRRETDGWETSEEIVALCACQRLMQALGAYGKLGMGDGKRAFLRHIPPAVANLKSVLAATGLLTGLEAVLELRPGALTDESPALPAA